MPTGTIKIDSLVTAWFLSFPSSRTWSGIQWSFRSAPKLRCVPG